MNAHTRPLSRPEQIRRSVDNEFKRLEAARQKQTPELARKQWEEIKQHMPRLAEDLQAMSIAFDIPGSKSRPFYISKFEVVKT